MGQEGCSRTSTRIAKFAGSGDGVQSADRANTLIAFEYFLAKVGGLGAQLPFVHTEFGTKGEAPPGYFEGTPAAETAPGGASRNRLAIGPPASHDSRRAHRTFVNEQFFLCITERQCGTKFETLGGSYLQVAAQEKESASELLVGSAQSMVAAEDLLRRGTAPQGSELAMPTAMVVMAHPDDETIALGARMGRLLHSCFVQVTDGAPRNEHDSRAYGFENIDDYRRARALELKAMFAEAGLQGVGSGSLNFRDQEAALNLVEIARQLARQIRDLQPEIIFSHPYEGGHPDHDACAFAVHHAVTLNRARGGKRALILEAPFYHAGPNGLKSGTFLKREEAMPEITYELSGEERKRKHELIACFTTQRETLKGFHDATERYRIAPIYDFSQAPHAGKVLYEHYPWGMDSEQFCQLAVEAEAELDEMAEEA